MKNLYSILQEIKNTNSKIGKENILRAHKDNKLLQETLKFLFDDLIVTGLSKGKISKPINLISVENANLLDLYEYLKINNSGKDKDIAYTKGVISQFKKEYGDEIAAMIKGIIIKDYPIGISKVTVNKVFGKGFIFKFDVRKGSKFEGELKPNTIYAQSVKLDGHRCIALIDESGVTLRGRSGKEYKGLVEIEQILISLYKMMKVPIMLDGELLLKDTENNHKSDELFSKTSQVLRTKGDKTNIEYILFDQMPLEEFMNGKSKVKFIERREGLEYLCDIINNELIKPVEILYIGDDIQCINEIQKDVELNGYEGTMLDDINALYETKRTKSLLKYKTFYTMDLKVIGLEEHRRGNKLGSLICEYKNGTVKVGSGFTDKLRKLYWDNPHMVQGKIAEIGYFELSKDQNGNQSLRFPTFKQIRDDKEEISYH
ncbi:ATP-dependent DNA ligase [Staphylococcus agnetis]|uniref:ATP-dependent DNA ligase n=1 Tax=Staphylococcus agnetis TaxID=985762 RepID=A0ABX3Z124_9STAP|nr:ATP-dependent DNA ligase [Staphylococcus agnetis]OSP23203.1 ATP-dependent DNA ligase [Staphylococcus agnetis]OTW30600.1 ATP-dependent DNA ligase [Staphylococcus agnetis]